MINDIASWITATPSLITSDDARFTKPKFNFDNEVNFGDYKGNRRLGFIYQHVCSKLFESSDNYKVIADEIQLNDHGRTLGAIDFIIKNQSLERLEHWEVAVKFYLLKDGLWYGPNAQDRLDKKLLHMLNHQLLMSQSSVFKTQYPQYKNPTPQLLLQGRLYINPFDQEVVPKLCEEFKIDDTQISGFWCYYSQLDRVQHPLYILDKPQWISGCCDYSKTLSTLDGLFEHCIDRNGQFWFIVNEKWPM